MVSLLNSLLLLGLLLLPGCQEKHPLPPLLQVGQRQLSLAQFQRELHNSYPDLAEVSETDQQLLKKQLVNHLVERELILGEANRLGVRLSPDELDLALSEVRASYSPEEFEQALKDAGQTLEGWSAALKQRLLTEKVSQAVLAPLEKVTSQDAEDYYLVNKEEFHRPIQLRGRQILLSSVEQANQVLKLLHEGGDFAELAREYSRSPDREDGGYLGYFSQGELPPEFDDVLFRLPIGRVSDPVESPYGVHLFLVENRRRAGIQPFKAVENEIIAKLTQQREENAFQQWLEDLRQQTPVKINWPLLNEPQKP